METRESIISDSSQSPSFQEHHRISEDLPPLAGHRVIDFGHYLAGPIAGMLLADQGAEVIKVDRPGHPSCATPAGAVFNRGKQVLELDLKSAAGREAARRLVASADVVIENFRPGVMERFGLGAAAMAAANPRLVYLSLPGFGAGEGRASLRAFEGVLGAATGLFTDLHSIRRELEAPPQYTPIPLASAYGAVHGALAVALALYAREESGRGEVIEVPLAGAAMSAMGAFLLRVADAPARYGKRPNPANDELRARMRQADAAERRRLIDQLRPWLPPLFDSYRAGNGRWVFLLAGNSRRNSVQLAKALGIYDGLIADGMVDLPPYPDLTRPNNIQDVDGLSREWKKTLRDRVAAAFRQQPAHDWTPIMRRFGVPFSVHRSTQEWLHAPETDAAALTVEVVDPAHGAIRQLGVQTSLGRTDRRWHVPRPARPGDLDALLRDLPAATTNGAGAAGGAVHAATRPAPILAGIKVLDLSTVLAGPGCARTLAEYGADVIKIDAPDPYFGPGTACMLHVEVGQGKRSMILDLKQEEGRRLFEQLAGGADVIVHNFRPGVAERLGIDYASLARINPGIVYLNLTAFNGPRRGPWTELPGFDPVLQAATGIQNRYGGSGAPPELHGFASCIDYLTGYSGTYGIALALLRRKREGGGDLVFTSLAQGGQLVQAPFVWATADARPDDGPQGQEVLGAHSLEHLYRAADGWLMLTGLPEDLPRLHEIPELAAVPAEVVEEDARIAALQAAIAERPVSHWETAFNAAGFGCHRVDCIEDVRRAGLREMTDAERAAWSDGPSISVIRLLDHPAGSPVDNPAPTYARFAGTSLRVTNPMPKIGSHTRAILRELGHDDARIDRWIAAGVAAEQIHDAYLPH
jgi:crotonobetainyl-CoA:carnitine CoA-transferase CaiB-like acyl-CoA transferase